jgi:hypothetical protein
MAGRGGRRRPAAKLFMASFLVTVAGLAAMNVGGLA